ncbi:hypothetical protein VNO77_18751 [Canavalia gladiata]|uniref:Uncharacterized protein n=1 Tax=Canavalia gladiata TaxID=3824 RepID=A0AAN9QKN3_CANGL
MGAFSAECETIDPTDVGKLETAVTRALQVYGENFYVKNSVTCKELIPFEESHNPYYSMLNIGKLIIVNSLLGPFKASYTSHQIRPYCDTQAQGKKESVKRLAQFTGRGISAEESVLLLWWH